MSAASGLALADRSRARWADLRLRLASALVLAPLALGCVWVGGVPWFLLLAVAGLGVGWEWAQMAGRSAPALLAGLAYTGLALLALVWLRADSWHGRAIVLFLLAVVWSSDIGAYLTGRLIGGRLLAPAISPGKTWSGAFGGLLAATAVGALWHARSGQAMLAACVLGVAAQCGDLLESAAKRHFGVKDSGRLIPGHGGLLDRLDGLMAAALVAGAWAWATGQGATAWL